MGRGLATIPAVMKRVLFALLLLTSFPPEEPSRTWTSLDGKSTHLSGFGTGARCHSQP